ncbi:MAG: tetratricopeptide (TPR) repeat protein [Gammaproteobacteria bacterium]|jgi:tetratricopeptide (TPR) repeat protein
MIDVSIIDHCVAEQGRFCVIDWLLSDDLLSYSDYESWRYGDQKVLEKLLRLDGVSLESLLGNIDKQCRALELMAEAKDFYRWDQDQKVSLKLCENHQQDRQMAQTWFRPQDRPQMDLFMDNSAQIVENAVLENLDNRSFEQALSQLQTLSELNPQNTRLGSYQDLINYGMHMQANPEIPQASLGPELLGFEQEVLPLANEILGSVARDYIASAWRRFAKSMQGHPFDPLQPNRHASSVLLKIPDYDSAINCLKTVGDLYHQAVLLERLAISYGATHHIDSALVVWCLLMEHDADYAERSIQQLQPHYLLTIWQDYLEFNESALAQYFSAFVLLKRPGLIHLLDKFPPLKLPASIAMSELLSLRASGGDEIESRRSLQSISPELLSIYLSQLERS